MRKRELVVGSMYAVAQGSIPAEGEDLRSCQLLRMELTETTSNRALMRAPQADAEQHGTATYAATFARVVCRWEEYLSECAVREALQLGEDGVAQVRRLRARAQAAGLPVRIHPRSAHYQVAGVNLQNHSIQLQGTLTPEALGTYLSSLAAGRPDGALPQGWLAPEYVPWSHGYGNNAVRVDAATLEVLISSAEALAPAALAAAA